MRSLGSCFGIVVVVVDHWNPVGLHDILVQLNSDLRLQTGGPNSSRSHTSTAEVIAAPSRERKSIRRRRQTIDATSDVKTRVNILGLRFRVHGLFRGIFSVKIISIARIECCILRT